MGWSKRGACARRRREDRVKKRRNRSPVPAATPQHSSTGYLDSGHMLRRSSTMGRFILRLLPMSPTPLPLAARLTARQRTLIILALSLGGFAIGTSEFASMGLML